MRRVSSRQRLVSWDAFDATAHEEDSNFSDNDLISNASEDDIGYDTALEETDSSPDLLSLLPSSSEASTTAMAGRKRDRSTRHAEQVKTVSSPKAVPSTAATAAICSNPASTATAAAALPAWAATPLIIPSYSWEIDDSKNDALNHSQYLKNSASTNTLSSFVSTCSTLPPSPTSSTPSTLTLLDLNALMKDMHVAIFAFLDLDSLQSVMGVNRQFRRLVLSQDAHASLWKHHCQDKWKVGKTTANATTDWNYLDRFHIPTAAGATDADAAALHTPNLSLLLRMTPDHCPTGVDKDLVHKQNLRTERLRPLLRHLDPHAPAVVARAVAAPPQEEQVGDLRSYVDAKTGRRLIQYTGPIGSGDRCIRSDHPLPRPKRDETTDQQQQQQKQQLLPKSQFFPNFLRRGANKMLTRSGSSSSLSSQQQPQQLPAKPFVVPFMENSTTVNVTPRLISYYEVTIVDNIQKNDSSSDEDVDDDESVLVGPALNIGAGAGAGAAPNGQRTDCVAVGLATESFHVHSRMPGWDRQSFGYHGDDGGIFHSSGTMNRQFGSKFGAGDTVGCGIDYVNQGIFFTLNGRFLGYGWTGIDEGLLQNNLYPVVGLDTNCPLHLNFGAEEPFQFDLSQFLMKHEQIISSQYSLVVEEPATAAAPPPPPKMTRELSMRSFPSASSLASLASTASSSRRRFRRRGGNRERTV